MTVMSPSVSTSPYRSRYYRLKTLPTSYRCTVERDTPHPSAPSWAELHTLAQAQAQAQARGTHSNLPWMAFFLG